MWRHIDVQTAYEEVGPTVGPHDKDISYGSLTCPHNHWRGATLYTFIPRKQTTSITQWASSNDLKRKRKRTLGCKPRPQPRLKSTSPESTDLTTNMLLSVVTYLHVRRNSFANVVGICKNCLFLTTTVLTIEDNPETSPTSPNWIYFIFIFLQYSVHFLIKLIITNA